MANILDTMRRYFEETPDGQAVVAQAVEAQERAQQAQRTAWAAELVGLNTERLKTVRRVEVDRAAMLKDEHAIAAQLQARRVQRG